MAKNKKVNVVNYKASPTIARFMKSNAEFKCITGAIGSGKSSGCCMEIYNKAVTATPCIDGVRRTRAAVVRNTYSQLESSTIKTWLHLFPEIPKVRRMYNAAPKRYIWKEKNFELEVWFIACDKPEDVSKFLSTEFTIIWLEEAAFLEKELVDVLGGRLRFPSQDLRPPHLTKKDFPSYLGIIASTNKDADEDNWVRRAATTHPVEGWEYFDQPGARSKDAENLDNLPYRYYEKYMKNKTPEHIRIYVDNEWGHITTGQPVYGSSFKEELHSSKELLKPIPNVPLDIGLDFGNTPAALITQLSPTGQRIILEEIITVDTSIENFANITVQKLQRDYEECPEHNYYGDPSGDFKDQNQKTTYDVLLSSGIRARPAPSNVIKIRLEAVIHELNKLVDGEPAYLINAKKCPTLLKGFKGGYEYKRFNVSGDRYDEKPHKNKFSHIHDANQYVLLSTGSYDMIAKNKRYRKELKPTIVNTDFSLW